MLFEIDDDDFEILKKNVTRSTMLTCQTVCKRAGIILFSRL